MTEIVAELPRDRALKWARLLRERAAWFHQISTMAQMRGVPVAGASDFERNLYDLANELEEQCRPHA